MSLSQNMRETEIVVSPFSYVHTFLATLLRFILHVPPTFLMPMSYMITGGG